MASLLLLTNATVLPTAVLPAIDLLGHAVRVAPSEACALVDAPPADAVLVDARRELASARSLCRLLPTTGVSARLRLAIGKVAAAAPEADPDVVRSGDLVIDEGTYTCRLRGRVLDLTFKEFELLKYLAQHPGRVFTRAQLLQEVWGYDYFGAEHEALIGTVRHVGYKFIAAPITPLAGSHDEEALRAPERKTGRPLRRSEP